MNVVAIIPALNEAEAIGPLVTGVLPHVSRRNGGEEPERLRQRRRILPADRRDLDGEIDPPEHGHDDRGGLCHRDQRNVPGSSGDISSVVSRRRNAATSSIVAKPRRVSPSAARSAIRQGAESLSRQSESRNV